MTWAIDPDLLETVADMGDGNGYQVARPTAATVAGRRLGAWRRSWLDQAPGRDRPARTCSPCRTPTPTWSR